MDNVLAIIVTHNRKELLYRCVNALVRQTFKCDILIVDNASTDNTELYFKDKISNLLSNVIYLKLNQNTGGAGGFYHGLKFAINMKWNLFWLMDDDALPKPDALKKLMEHVKNNKTIYGSLAYGKSGNNIIPCWPVQGSKNRNYTQKQKIELIDEIEEVKFLPFLGFLISKKVIEMIGYPDRKYFLYADDKEYSERARRAGVKLYLVKDSMIEHPLPHKLLLNFLGISFSLRPFNRVKTYYDVRNKLLVAKEYYRFFSWCIALLGLVIRMIAALWYEKKKTDVYKTYLSAIKDGLKGKKGKNIHLHENQKILQSI